MATKIHILPEQLTNKIAAGEVVERPASVVKELLENALDAGSTDIRLDIEGGGRQLIRVVDNGCGMSREDALLALERHATSKIATDGDLFSLTTLGFRGEALPSIASVSRFLLATRETGRVEGTEIYAEGGRIKEVKVCGMAEGTVMEVRNLFFNTPARLKFMKSRDTEAGHVGELLTRLAISRPETRFTYSSDSKTVFRLLPGDLRSRIAALLGTTVAAEMYPVRFESEGLLVHGLVSRPECSRSNAAHLHTFINGRFIRDRVVQHAILQAYRNVLERGRYPVLVLFIEVPMGEVDVNVHPTKHEVRFRDQRRVHDLLQEAVETELAASPWRRPEAGGGRPFASPSAVSAAETRVSEIRESLAAYRPSLPRRDNLSFAAVSPSAPLPESSFAPPREEPLPVEETGYFSRLQVLGQFRAAYLVCQEGNELVLVDQHAAHERVAFEKLKQQYADHGVEGQGLLFPETLELSFSEAAAVSENLEELNRLGFILEPFGGATWMLQGVPHLLAKGNYQRTFRDIVAEMQTIGRSRSFSDQVEEVLMRIACHSVVRGERLLSRDEIQALFSQMDKSEYAGTCPHGRPVLRTISLKEIEKMFKRN